MAQAPQRPPQGPPPDSLTVGLGAGVAPRFIGSDDYQVVPFPSIEWRTSSFTLRTNQFGFELDLDSNPLLDIGPIIRIDGGRGDLQGVGDPVVEALGQVNLAPELGGYVAITRPLVMTKRGPSLLATARLSAVHAIGGHDGLVIEASGGLVKPGPTWTFIGNVGATFASGSYHRSYFSVDAAGSAASGLDPFDADGGLRDIRVTGIARYALTSKWSLTGVAGYNRLIGDAADSPIVTERGSANQLFFGLNVSYKVF